MSPNTQFIHLSLASFPGMSPINAMSRYQLEPIPDSLFGLLNANHVQICPQNCIKQLDEAHAEALMDLFPNTRFRLHANVKVLEQHHPRADLSHYRMYTKYFHRLAELSKCLSAPGYTLHAGLRKQCSWADLFRFREKIELMMGVPVGIEGHYSTPDGRYWLDSFDEYRRLFEANVPFALDLSHLHIIACQTGQMDIELITEMLASPNCIEVHVSHNDGVRDLHLTMPSETDLWWLPLLTNVRPDAPIFYEGNLQKIHTH